jgi:hypothetical protein
MSSIATFASAFDADLVTADESGKVSVQVIGVAIEDGTGDDRLHFVVVDHDGRGRLVPASGLRFTDDAVMPPKYG